MHPSPIPDIRWLDAETADGQLHASQIAHWRERGFVFVRGLLPEALIAQLAAAAGERFPQPGTPEANRYTSFGGPLNFPSDVDGFNALTLHPALLGAIGALLGERVCDLRLTQADLWVKYGREDRPGGRQDNADQRIHVDYPNHTLVHPPEWSRPEAVELIVYLDHVSHCGGPTAVVPRDGVDDPAYRWPIVDSPGIGDLDYVNDRSAAEGYLDEARPELSDWRQALYDRERYARFAPGDVLFYRHDTWHRGTPMSTGTRRLVHNMTVRRAASEWISTVHKGWAWSAYRPDRLLGKLIASATLEQRAVLGFPQPGNPYWSEATIDAVAARHGVFGMDMQPYRDALTPTT